MIKKAFFYCIKGFKNRIIINEADFQSYIYQQLFSFIYEENSKYLRLYNQQEIQIEFENKFKKKFKPDFIILVLEETLLNKLNDQDGFSSTGRPDSRYRMNVVFPAPLAPNNTIFADFSFLRPSMRDKSPIIIH